MVYLEVGRKNDTFVELKPCLNFTIIYTVFKRKKFLFNVTFKYSFKKNKELALFSRRSGKIGFVYRSGRGWFRDSAN